LLEIQDGTSTQRTEKGERMPENATETKSKKIDTPCPHCGREEHQEFEPLGTWYKPCPADDCPSNNRQMGKCPRCGGVDLEVEGTDIEAWTDDTPFPTISVRFQCQGCDHVIEVSYDREDGLHQHNNREARSWSYDPDPDGMLDLDEEE
jgi:hypothetical protein